MKVVEVDYGRIASSTIQALSEARPSAGLLFCLAFNILIITGVAVLCIAGYGFARGLGIVVLALAPTLALLNIALFARVELFARAKNEQQPSLLRTIATNSKELQRGETLDEKNSSIVPEISETANTQSSLPSKTFNQKNSWIAGTASTQSGAIDPIPSPPIAPGVERQT
jgi:uncharacterized membrane protein YhiD involved in acid resistance